MTFLDLLVIVSGGIIAAGLLTLAAMFLLKSERARRVALYAAAGLGLYLGYVGFRVNAMSDGIGGLLDLVLALVGLGAVVLDRFLSREASFRKYIPQLAAAVSVLGGLANAFI